MSLVGHDALPHLESRLLATKMPTTERQLKANCIQLRLENDK